ncbi:N-formylglutamate amidohydrolase [Thalassobaculum sp. OXR-137]|uniref:N-formylglutamate amidohydrolase n=1 Tax=Thalassobaculum sp. OXR-137 TaxID=3100173 RepID=UPI002AC9CA39|nr:N-formylglutamate amidohydrolase [Thalassobaculum sp. OXR-137]WPZ35630.1 N-formylglutamate amidohydrolase [Thalassobaculum sp. OXR-137]
MTLLTDTDPPAFEVVNPDSTAPVVFVSDHNANAVPAALKALGLPERELARHIGYDIGIDRVARRLADRFSAPLVVSGYSRLACDVNRVPFSAGSMPEISDGTPVPANQGLAQADRQARYDALFHPYHDAIAALLDRRMAGGERPLFVALHSFTPALVSAPAERPWEIGFLWDEDSATSALAMRIFRSLFPDVCVGDNQPYSGATPEGYSIPVHAERRGLKNLCLEFRQDLIADPAGGDLWADRFGDALAELLRTAGKG